MTTLDLREIRRLRQRRELAERDLRDAIVEAFRNREGTTIDDIAEAAGLSRPRIYQIVEEAKR